MAEFYLDVSAIGNEYQAYADTPTAWAVPQDGNGLAGPGGTPAVAIGTIECAAASASGAGILAVLGVTVSSTLTGSGATLATNIRNAINAAGGATGATYSAALLPLNRLVFARINPGVTTQVQIMLRIAGTDWNGFTHTTAGTWGTVPVMGAFAGGVNGPFAYVNNFGYVAFGIASSTYGLLSQNKVASVIEPDAPDVIHIRTRRSGANLSWPFYSTSASTIQLQVIPTDGCRNLVADAGIVWVGDSGVFTLDFTRTQGLSVFNVKGASLTIQGNKERFRFYLGAGSGRANIDVSNDSIRAFTEVLFEEDATNISAGFNSSHGVNGGSRSTFTQCRFIAKGPRIVAFSQGTNNRFFFLGCVFEYFSLTGDVSNIVSIASVASTDVHVEFTACRFFDRAGVYEIISPVTSGINGGAPIRIIFDSCTGVKNVASGATSVLADGGRQLLWENFGPTRDWRVEPGAFVAEWRTDENFPTLLAQRIDGTYWSAKVTVRSIIDWGYNHRLLKMPGYYRASSAVRTAKMEFLAYELTSKSQLALTLAYIDENNNIRFETTQLGLATHKLARVNCPTSAAAWTLNGQAGLTAYKLELVTQFPVKQFTEYVAWATFTGDIAGDTQFYFEPEVTLT